MNYTLKRWEFSALLLESVVLSGAVVALFLFLGRAMRVPGVTAGVSELLWTALAFASGGLCLLPVLSADARNAHGRVVSIGRRVGWILLAGLVGAGIRYFWP